MEAEQAMRAIQASLRDFVKSGLLPGVKTPGYYHDVPPGQTAVHRSLQRFFSAPFIRIVGKGGKVIAEM
jgi:hypothetical protein